MANIDKFDVQEAIKENQYWCEFKGRYEDMSKMPRDWNLKEYSACDLYYKEFKTVWIDRVAEGWYGFEMWGVPLGWLKIINDFLMWLQNNSPTFEIYQIKIKFGGIRIHLDSITSEARHIIVELEKILYDERLIW